MPIPRSVPKPEAASDGVQPDNELPPRRAHTGPKPKVTYQPLTLDESRYVVVILQGADQSGKTHFAFTAPKPILVLTFDPGNIRRGVSRQFAGQDIQLATFEVPKGLVMDAELARIGRAEADRYSATMMEAIEGDRFKTIVMDREDEAWELYRIEEFGADARAKGHHYVDLNRRYRGMLKLAEKHKKNLIMIDAFKDEWKNDKPTGRKIREGFKHLGMLSQLTLETQVDDYNNFQMQVIRCRDDATKNGMLINTEFLTKELLERYGEYPVNPETGEADWYWMNFANTMAYLIGGTPDDWK